MKHTSCTGRAATADGALPEYIAGIDMALGLNLLAGKKSLYLHILRKFLLGHKDVSVEIRQALAADDWETAELKAHNTKGVSGCIGATGLQRRAADLERAIRTQSQEIHSRLLLFETALTEVMADLEAKLPAEQSPLQEIMA